MEVFDFNKAKKEKKLKKYNMDERTYEALRYIYSAISEYTNVPYNKVSEIKDIQNILQNDVHKLAHIINCGFYGAKRDVSEPIKQFIYKKGFQYFKNVDIICDFVLRETL